MGSSILSGINAAGQAAGLFGSSAPGSNTPTFGEASQIASITATALGATDAILTAVPALAGITDGSLLIFSSVAGPIAMGVAVVLSILGRIFKGADPNQVPAAQIEQVFEAAADNGLYLARAGYLSISEAQTFMQKLIQAGDLYYQQAVSSNAQYRNDPRPFTNGQANMTKVITNEITGENALAGVTPIPVIPWDAVAGPALFIQDGAPGWYSAPGESIDAAAQLTSEFMAALRQASPVSPASTVPIAAAPVVSSTASVQSAVATIPTASALPVAAAVVSSPQDIGVPAPIGASIGAASAVAAPVAAAQTSSGIAFSSAWLWAALAIAIFLLLWMRKETI